MGWCIRSPTKNVLPPREDSIKEATMAHWNRFEDMKVWRDGRALVRKIYQISSNRPFSRDFGLREQIRRAAVSTVSNIAEGYERDSHREFLRYLHISKGSCGEVRTQLYLAQDLAYLSAQDFTSVYGMCLDISKQLAGMIRYFKNA